MFLTKHRMLPQMRKIELHLIRIIVFIWKRLFFYQSAHDSFMILNF